MFILNTRLFILNTRFKNTKQKHGRPYNREHNNGRPLIHDEFRLTDPMRAEEVDFKPDAVEEWKHRRHHTGHVDPRFVVANTPDAPDETSHLDVKG